MITISSNEFRGAATNGGIDVNLNAVAPRVHSALNISQQHLEHGAACTTATPSMSTGWADAESQHQQQH